VLFGSTSGTGDTARSSVALVLQSSGIARATFNGSSRRAAAPERVGSGKAALRFRKIWHRGGLGRRFPRRTERRRVSSNAVASSSSAPPGTGRSPGVVNHEAPAGSVLGLRLPFVASAPLGSISGALRGVPEFPNGCGQISRNSQSAPRMATCRTVWDRCWRRRSESAGSELCRFVSSYSCRNEKLGDSEAEAPNECGWRAFHAAGGAGRAEQADPLTGGVLLSAHHIGELGVSASTPAFACGRSACRDHGSNHDAEAEVASSRANTRSTWCSRQSATGAPRWPVTCEPAAWFRLDAVLCVELDMPSRLHVRRSRRAESTWSFHFVLDTHPVNPVGARLN
jgi:hypothetical protein